MENKKIDFVAHESMMSRLEKANKRLFIENIVLIIVLFLIVGGILVYSMLPSETTSINGTQEANGSNIQQNVGK